MDAIAYLNKRANDRIMSMTDAEWLEQEARDMARCDCQLWDNLPESVKNTYRREAEAEVA